MRKKAFRFTVSGILATGIHVLVAVSAIAVFAMGPVLANGIAFLIATLFSFMVNTLWSFSSRARRDTIGRFAVVSAVGGATSVLVSGAAQGYGLHYLLGIGLVVVTIPPITFLLHNFWTYR